MNTNLSSFALFEGLSKLQIEQVLSNLHADFFKYSKGNYLLSAGQTPRFGLLIEGSAQVIKEDFWGHRSLLAQLQPGDLFGESFVLSNQSSLPVSVIANDSVKVVFLHPEYFFDATSFPPKVHAQLVTNLARILAQKNLVLSQKIEHITKRSIRTKLLSYLSQQALQAHNPCFSISMNRQQLADYLSVDRSALCSELSRMQKEGILEYRKNHFILYDTEPSGY